MGFDGFILLAILMLFFAYLLPTLIRTAQVARDARGDDRFSADLRIVARAGEAAAPPIVHQTRTQLHRKTEAPMEPPVAYKLIAADARRVAAARAARAAAASRRAAAARRRLLLTAALGLLTVGLWVLAGATPVSVWAAIVPTAVTVGVVELGRRAAAAGRSADARLADAVRIAERQSVSAAVRAAAPNLRVDVDPARVAPEPAERTVVAGTDAAASGESASWTPVPVPPPAYTLKKAAPRRSVSAVLVDDAGAAQAAPSDAETEFMPAVQVEALTAAQLAGARAEREAALAEAESAAEPEAATGSSLNVQEILARRRAVG
ncbi:hypothetical protein GCG21_00975 [Pseudactinotalea sp. HY160]|uniref:hypothetical protein n=1 Tax=Pseudactinotalea sp. HY160 TaxID=2654490 RepID=UPI00128DA418|nr:hypothetical protein [Pseudactinotalea sp. HY160]MPV48605.1 hypothetical protein [Pseudactinotalea sp. HY160]